MLFGCEDRDHEVSRILGLAASHEVRQTGGLLQGSGWVISLQDDRFGNVGALLL